MATLTYTMMKENSSASLLEQSGLTLVELLISLAIASILSVGIFSFMQNLYAGQIETQRLAQRTQQALIMKAALDNTASAAGSVASPTLSNAGTQNGSTPFNLLGAISTFLFGNCPDTGLLGSVYNLVNNTADTFLDDLFFGGYDSAHSTATEGNGNLTQVTIPSQPIAVTASTLSFYWLVAHPKGGDELCHGSMQISGNILKYEVSGSAKSGHSLCGVPGGNNSGSTEYPVGPGWSFSDPVPNAQCLGQAYPGATPEAIVATDASSYGMNPVEVTVCLPAM
jgi:prepilin-type N-terminal cleavage/methylation domain-containing protein